MRLKVVLLGLFALLSLSLAWWVYHSNDSLLSTASGYFKDGELKEAASNLNEMQNKLDPAAYQLYMAYIDRDKHDLSSSDARLDKASKLIGKNGASAVYLEVILNQMFNAYEENNFKKLEELNKKVSDTPLKNNEWVVFFQNLRESLESKKTPENLKIPEKYLSNWMEKDFGQTFNNSWLNLQTIQSQIDKGDFLRIRQDLKENRYTQVDPNETNFLIGMTYAKEASNKSPVSAIPYWRLAFGYLDKVSGDDFRFRYSLDKVNSEILKDTKELVKSNSFSNLHFYIEQLKKINDPQNLQDVANQLVVLLNNKLNFSNWDETNQIIVLLNEIIGKDSLGDTLIQKFESLLGNSLETGNFTQIDHYFEALKLLGVDGQELSNKFSKNIATKILDYIPNDNQNLLKTLPYVSFWKMIEKDGQKRLNFSEELVALAKQLWVVREEPIKAIVLMKVASTIPFGVNQTEFNDFLEKNVNAIYSKALKEDNVDQFQYVLLAVKELNLKTVNILDKKEALHQLKDAEYLYHSKRFSEAKKRALWSLQVDPQDQNAKRLAGLSDYAIGSYENALKYLNGLPLNDYDVAKAVSISELVTGDEASGEHLLERLGNLDDPDILRIAYGYLMHSKVDEALKWLQKVKKQENEYYVGMLVADYLAGNWAGVDKYFSLLTYPYNQLEGLNTKHIEALWKVGKFDQAEEILNNLLKSRESLKNVDFPSEFLVFKPFIDSPSKYYIAALYYKEVKHNNEAALKFINQIPTPTPSILVWKAEIYKGLGMTSEALQILSKLSIVNDQNPKFLTLYGQLCADTNQFMEAELLFSEYFKKNPNDNEYRATYALTLMQTKLYQEANQQYAIIKGTRPLTEDEELKFIESFIKTDQFKEALEEAKSIQKMSLENKLVLERILIPVRQTQNDKIGEDQNLTLPEAIQYIQLKISQGDFEKALKWADRYHEGLQKVAEGLMVLAELSRDTSQLSVALTDAEDALNINPFSLEALKFLQSYDNRVDSLNKRIFVYIELLKNQPNSISLQVALCHSLISIAVEKLQKGEIAVLHSSPELEKAHQIIESLAKKYPQFPEILYLYGRILYLLDNDSYAQQALTQAINIDNSYSKAYAISSSIVAKQGFVSEAISLISKALKYTPDNSDFWEMLGLYSQQFGSQLDAINAFENALKYQPNRISSYLYLATLFEITNDPENAIALYKKALDYEPKNGKIITSLIKILNHPSLRFNNTAEDINKQQLHYYQLLKELDPKEAKALSPIINSKSAK